MQSPHWLHRAVIVASTALAVFIICGAAASIVWLPVELPSKATLPTGQLPNAAPRTVTLRAVGDIMLSRHVGTQMVKHNDWAWPWQNLAPLLSSADITMGNLESPFFNSGPRVTEGMVFKAEPAALAGLITAGFDVLTLSNNHMLNQGVAGLKYTLATLASAGIAPIGAGVDFTAAHRPAVIIVGDTKFAFLGYGYEPFQDQADGQFVVVGLDTKQMTVDVTAARQAADVVIVTMHAGTEYVTDPTDQQIEFAHAALDTGADLVIGHHPHWVQRVEQYKDKWIFYSLGNFVFDQEWSQETKEGAMLEAKWQEGKLQSLELLPIIVEGYAVPRLATLAEAQRIWDRLGLKSGVITTSAVDNSR